MVSPEQSGSGPYAGLSVVEQVAAADGVDSADLPPLNHTVDVDAIDRLVASHDGGTADERIEFTYAGYHVTVGLDGDVSVDSTD